MVEEIESPVESLQEELHHAAEHAQEKWLKWAALLSAFFAVFAAVAGLQSAHFANDAMIEQIEASDQWNYYQAKSIKAVILQSETAILKTIGKGDLSAQNDKLQDYAKEQQDIKGKAEAKIAESKFHLKKHEIFSKAVTFFQISIVMVAISVLTKRRRVLTVASAFGVVGIVFFVQGLL